MQNETRYGFLGRYVQTLVLDILVESMKTLEQLLDLASQGRLDELDRLAAEVQGWKSEIQDDSIFGEGELAWIDGNWGEVELVEYYRPTLNKAQAWDLMVKAKLNSDFGDNQCIWYEEMSMAHVDFDDVNKDPLIAVTIAFILARQGEE